MMPWLQLCLDDMHAIDVSIRVAVRSVTSRARSMSGGPTQIACGGQLTWSWLSSDGRRCSATNSASGVSRGT